MRKDLYSWGKVPVLHWQVAIQEMIRVRFGIQELGQGTACNPRNLGPLGGDLASTLLFPFCKSRKS